MISVASSSIRITSRPRSAPIVNTPTGLEAYFSLAVELEAIGSVTFTGRPGDAGTGWTVGFVQAQWIETNWAVYRGEAEADGSVFVQRGRPPARARQACIDSAAAAEPFYGLTTLAPMVPLSGVGPALPFVATLPATPAFPATVNVLHIDAPADSYPFERINSLTGKTNVLRSAQLEFAFCTMLVVRPPSGPAQFLRGFYWNVNWQADFRIHHSTQMLSQLVTGGNSCNVGAIFTGAPRDNRFGPVLSQPQTMTCNDMMDASRQSPNVREERGWPLFDVRR